MNTTAISQEVKADTSLSLLDATNKVLNELDSLNNMAYSARKRYFGVEIFSKKYHWFELTIFSHDQLNYFIKKYGC